MLRTLFGMGPKVDLKEVLAKGATIVDVRSAGEYAGGHIKGSVNIPLDQLEQRMHKLPKDKAIIACCLSGARSGRAVDILKAHGLEAYNGGGWSGLNAVVRG
ncbi:MAG: rhodanese-like domain-containing protein [Flavobacteriales bacterium]|nr:rhodanese-like domain-containing protein [Flavobacteriales bacterium]MCB0769516.1 rhodanese-like domain-containing protein [Flavobacteriales bacterium]